MITIPERIRDEAREWAERLDCNQERATSVISKAIFAAEKRGREEERERCAKIVDDMGGLMGRTPAEAATFIRSTN